MELLQKKKKNRVGLDIRVSVIVATYRREGALKRALESIINQTYQSIEVIVVDDNSDNNWNSRVKAIIDQINLIHPVIYIKNEVNKGSAETRNIGIRISKGDFITFLDDDDVYLPNKVENQVKHMIYKKSDYSITDLALYDEKERLIEKRTRKYIKKNNKKDLFRYHLMHHITGTDTLMFKRDYLLRIGGFPQIDVGDEFYLMQRAIEGNGIFSYLPICDVKAYVHSETDGLSIGDSKIKGENILYEHKKKYFLDLSDRDIRYIKMRHYAVLAFAEIRAKKIMNAIKYSIYSFIVSPTSFIKLLFTISI